MTVIAGVALDAYAFVHAALAEGHSLESVLTHEGIDPLGWSAIDEAWADALSDSIDTDLVLSDAYDAELMNAQDRFERSVEPLASDYAAFLRFTREWSAAEDPGQFLRDHELRLPDMMRLQRSWGTRIREEEDLRRRAAEAAEQMETIPGPQVVVGPPRTLSDVRPPTSPGRTTASTSTAPAQPELPPLLAPLPTPISNADALAQAIALVEQPPTTLDAPVEMTAEQYGQLHAYLATYGNDDESVYARFGIVPSQLASIDRMFTERFATDRALLMRFDHAYTSTYVALQRKP